MQKSLLIVGESLPSLWQRWLLPGWDCAILMSRSDVRAVPFYSWLKDLVPSMSDVSAEISPHCG